MAKENENNPSEAERILAQRVAAALFVARTGSDENPFQLVNDYNLREQKKQVVKAHYDKLGYTVPTAAYTLLLDSERDVRHSRILGTNIRKADPTQLKDATLDAHHIVGRLGIYAETARRYLFNWGIGINDADNGVYLPRYATTKVVSMPAAHNHQGIHTRKYYFNVTMRLAAVNGEAPAAGRLALRAIKNELISGTFPV